MIPLVTVAFGGLSKKPVNPIKGSSPTSDSLRRILRSNSTDSTIILTHYRLGQEFLSHHNHDSALFYLNRAVELSEKQNDKILTMKVYSAMIDFFFNSKNFSLALEYNFRLLKHIDEAYLEKNPDSLIFKNLYSQLYSQIGLCYFNIENPDMALAYFNKGLTAAEERYKEDPSMLNLERKFVNLLNVGGVYTQKKQFYQARKCFEKAIELNHTLDNLSFYAAVYNNLGIIYKEEKNYKKSFEYYNRSLEIREQLKDSAGMAQVLNNLGEYYYIDKDFRNAITSLNKSINYSRQTGTLRSEMLAYQFLTETYEKMGDYRKALESHKTFKLLYDSITGSDQTANAARLEVQYQYEKQKKESELQQEIELARKERQNLIILIIAAVLLMLFVIALLLMRNQKIQIRQNELSRKSLELESKNLALEKQNLLLENEKLELELDMKKKELTTQVMYLMQKNEFMASILKEIQDLRSSVDQKSLARLQSIVRDMKSNIDTKVWDEFEVRFQQVHQDFYDKLNELHPDLTPNEVKLCAFLRLNMTTKDISAITYQSAKSIQVARARLRKKIEIERDENLVSYLRQL
jgi:tetratricopeptide (TPR) repeat protein